MTKKMEVWEQAIPVLGAPEHIVSRMPPWLGAQVGQNKTSVQRHMAQRWDRVREPWLRPLTEKLCSFHPSTIVGINKSLFYLRLDRLRPNPTPRQSENGLADQEIYLAEPQPEAEIKRSLAAIGFDKHRPLFKFLCALGELRESEPGMSGGFLPISQWTEFGTEDWQLPAMQPIWRGARILFDCRNGDEVIVHPSGRVGYFYHEAAEIRQIAKSFDYFVELYTATLDLYYPFFGSDGIH